MPNIVPLSEEDVLRSLDSLPSNRLATVRRVRYKNQTPMVRVVQMSLTELRSLISTAIDEGHIPGGDLEVDLPGLKTTLIGHHDGIFWHEPIAELR